MLYSTFAAFVGSRALLDCILMVTLSMSGMGWGWGYVSERELACLSLDYMQRVVCLITLKRPSCYKGKFQEESKSGSCSPSPSPET